MSTVVVAVTQLQAALNNAKAGDVLRVEGGEIRGEILNTVAAVQIMANDLARPPVFKGGTKPDQYGLHGNTASKYGPGLVFSNPIGYGLGVVAQSARNLDGASVVGCHFVDCGGSGLYSGANAGRVNKGLIVEDNLFERCGGNLAADPHSPPGDGLHSSYIGGGEGLTTAAIFRRNKALYSLNGQAFQFGGGFQNGVITASSAGHIRKVTPSASSYAGFGIFSSFQGSKGNLIDGCYVFDCDGYGFKALGSANEGTVTNSHWSDCALGGIYLLKDGGGNGPAPAPGPSPDAAQAAIDLIRSSNPKIADAVQKTLDYAKATT